MSFKTSSTTIVGPGDTRHSPSFQLALDQYSQQHGADGALGLWECTIQDVLETITRMELNKHKLASRFHVRSRVNSLVTFVDRYAKAVDCLVQTASGGLINPATLIWGLLRVLLEIASSAARYTASVMGLLDELGQAVSLYAEYEGMFAARPRFQKALVAVFVDIIGVLAKARKVLSKSKPAMLLRYFTSTFERDFENDLGSVKSHLASLESETTLAHRVELHSFVAATTPRLAALEPPDARSSLYQSILAWLSPLDGASRLRDIESTRHPGSGSWLLQRNAYTNWKHNPAEPVLWITGPPGVGKTVLSSVVIRDLQQAAKLESSTTAFFHCDAGNESARSTTCLLSAVISHILEDVYVRDDAALPQCLEGAYRKSARFGRQTIAQADRPEDILRGLLAEQSHTTLIVDGVDELDRPEDAIQTLLELSSGAASFRVAFLGRSVPSTNRLLSASPTVRVAASDTAADMSDFVRARAQGIPAHDQEMRERVVGEICAKADGMFLWTRMVLDDMANATSLGTLREKLHQCPTGLHAIYGHFVRNLASQPPCRRRLARDILLWTCCAARPLALEELEVALATSLAQGQVADDERPFRSVIVDLCSPFITVASPGNLVRPVHHSVREYLLDPANVSRLGHGVAAGFIITEQNAHAELAARCLRYLEGVLPAFLSTTEDLHGFSSYAMSFWCHHALRGAHEPGLEEQIGIFLAVAAHRQAWLYEMLFRGSSPFPFQNIFRLHHELNVWCGQAMAPASALPSLLANDWSMDALDLLFRLPDGHCDPGCVWGHQANSTGISYFEKMMVARDLARRLTQTKQLPHAVARLEAAAAAQAARRPEAPHSCAFAWNALGILYDQQGRAALALATHRRALDAQEDFFGAEHARTIWSVNELGRMHRHLGHLDASETLHRRALAALARHQQPADHPERVWTASTLGTTLRMVGRADEALALHEWVYEARVRSLGARHAHTLWTCADVAKCHGALGRPEEALVWFWRALDGRVDLLGPDHADTLWSMNNVAAALASLGRRAEAVVLHARALAGQEKILGPDHAHTQWTRDVLENLCGAV